MEDMGTNDDELFSMDDLEKDLKKARGARRLPWFSAGLVLGIAGTIFVPGLDDLRVFVLGAIAVPGALEVTNGPLTLTDVITRGGGPRRCSCVPRSVAGWDFSAALLFEQVGLNRAQISTPDQAYLHFRA